MLVSDNFQKVAKKLLKGDMAPAGASWDSPALEHYVTEELFHWEANTKFHHTEIME